MNADKLEIIKFQIITVINEIKILFAVIFDLTILEENLDFEPIDFNSIDDGDDTYKLEKDEIYEDYLDTRVV